jgi:hypothetical protein
MYLGSSAALGGGSRDGILQFDDGDVPSEIQALGAPQRVHKPNPLAAKLAGWRYLFAFLLVGGLGSLYALIFLELQKRGQLDQLVDPYAWFTFGIIGAVAVGAAIWLVRLRPATATVFFYPTAAVIADAGKLTLIPWDQLLWLPGRILTSEGHSFACGWMEDHDRFEEAIWERSAEHWVPAALAKVKAGQTVKAGELAVSAAQIGYAGKTAAWEEVTNMILIHGRRYQLNVYTQSWIAWAEINLYTIPNARAIERLLSSIAPPRLLKPAGPT